MKIRSLFFFLAGLYPATHFAAHNWHMFTTDQIILLLIVCPFGSLALLSVIHAAISLLRRAVTRGQPAESGAGSPAYEKTAVFLSTAAAVLLCAFLFRHVYQAIHPSQLLIWSIVSVAAVLIALLTSRQGPRAVTSLLLILTVVTVVQWGLSYRSAGGMPDSASWYDKDRDLYDGIQFARKPNLYYILSESYPNREALAAVYGIDNSDFYSQLQARRFNIFHAAYSNYTHTMSSVPSVFAMAHHYYKLKFGELDSYGGRDIVAGNVYSPVIDILRNNGYQIQFIHEVEYLLRKGASVDYYWPRRSVFLAVSLFWAGEKTDNNKPTSINFDQNDFRSVLEGRIEKAAGSSKPHLTFVYINHPKHSPIKAKAGSRPHEYYANFRQNVFPPQLTTANEIILSIVDDILARDDRAVIIIAGDHGSWGHRMEVRPDGSRIPQKILALDRLGILMAIRLPENTAEELIPARITNVNLFRYIFASLDGTGDILSTRQPDNGYIGSRLVLLDGVLLDRWK